MLIRWLFITFHLPQLLHPDWECFPFRFVAPTYSSVLLPNLSIACIVKRNGRLPATAFGIPLSYGRRANNHTDQPLLPHSLPILSRRGGASNGIRTRVSALAMPCNNLYTIPAFNKSYISNHSMPIWSSQGHPCKTLVPAGGVESPTPGSSDQCSYHASCTGIWWEGRESNSPSPKTTVLQTAPLPLTVYLPK